MLYKPRIEGVQKITFGYLLVFNDDVRTLIEFTYCVSSTLATELPVADFWRPPLRPLRGFSLALAALAW